MIFSNLKISRLRFNHFKENFIKIVSTVFNLIVYIPCEILKLIREILYIIINNLIQYQALYRKICKIIITILVVGFMIFDISYYYYTKNSNMEVWNPINKYCLYLIYIIVSYNLLILILRIYYYFSGKYIYFKKQQQLTEQFILTKMQHILKVFGKTRVGKDTFVAGATSVIVRNFKAKTDEEIANIKNICYIFDFDKLEKHLNINYKAFTSSSKDKIKENFFKMAKMQRGYIKNDYLNKISYSKLYSDYLNFLKSPVEYKSAYTFGVGVSKKHFIDMIIEYIQLYIRKYIEKSYTLFNQPFYEDIEEGKTSKIFSINFTATKTIQKPILNTSSHKREMTQANVFYPWKDRLVIGETECGTWYLNVDSSIKSYIVEMGARDFKAYQGHLINELYWFQVDQEPDRINKLIRVLDHGYCGIVYREEIKGGAKQIFFINIFLFFIKFNINRIEKDRSKRSALKIKIKNKINYLNQLYFASNNKKYLAKIKKLEIKLNFQKKYKSYNKCKEILNKYLIKINELEKTGYIKQVIVLSENGAMPLEINPISLEIILNDNKLRLSNTYITTVVHKISDCERYDTRYMKNLGEERAKNSIIDFAELPEWPKNFKMTKKEIAYMGYPTAQSMFNIKEEEFNDIIFRDKINDYKIKI